MATYVTLYNFTDQGLKNIKDTVKRKEAAKKAAAAVGGDDKGVCLDARAIRHGRDHRGVR